MFGIGSFHETQAYEQLEAMEEVNWEDRASFRSRTYSRPKPVLRNDRYVCRYCNAGNMRWVNTPTGYRMKDQNGNIHECLKAAASERLEFKKKSQEAKIVQLLPKLDSEIDIREINFLAAEAALEDAKDQYRYRGI